MGGPDDQEGVNGVKSAPQEQKGNLIGALWQAGGADVFFSLDPATGKELWRGCAASKGQVDEAIDAASGAFRGWRDLGFEGRLTIATAFAEVIEGNREELALLISREVGKPLWESRTEVASMIAKVAISAEAHHLRCAEESRLTGGALSWTRFRPHGVVAVFGPFNFPGHIANGHIVPALLAGNSVVFKPSEHAPATAVRMAEMWRDAGLPPGVLNVLQGPASTGEALASHSEIDGLFFTGSHETGMALHRLFAASPEKILALEMGGNNPLLVFEPEDLGAAALVVIQSSFLTAGQRCTCARRLIIPDTAKGEDLLNVLKATMSKIRVGPFDQTPEPFMGPVISTTSAGRILEAQENLLNRGAWPLVTAKSLGTDTGLISPGLLDVTDVKEREDREIFGPFLQVVRVPDFEGALTEANGTRFGLAAGLISRRKELWETFRREIRAGVINWNQQLTGASSRSPFGGLGQSGNHRPSGYLAADYCAAAIATLERATLERTSEFPTGFEQQ